MGRTRTRMLQADRARSFAALRGLSDEGLLYLHDVFERKRQGAGPTWGELLADLQTKFGFAWNDSSLSRYYGFWEGKLRVEQQAHHEAIDLAEHFLRNPTPEAERLLAQLLEHQRLVALSNLDGADPTDVVALGLAHDRVDLARRRLDLEQKGKDIQRRQLELNTELVALETRKVELRERAHAIATRVEEKAKAIGKTLDPEVAKMIREEVYGLPAE